MKQLKKILAIVLISCLSITMVGCGQKNIEGNLSDLMDKIYEGIDESSLPMMLMNVEVTEENVEYYLGSADIEFEEALASESAVGSIAYSVVLVRAKDGANIENLKKQIKENVNPAKWICVSVEKDNVIVDNIGDLVILIMSNEMSEEIQTRFQNLK